MEGRDVKLEGRKDVKTYVKKDKSLGPIDRIPLEVLGSSLQHLLIDTSNHLSHTIYQPGPKTGVRKLTVTQQ